LELPSLSASADTGSSLRGKTEYDTNTTMRPSDTLLCPTSSTKVGGGTMLNRAPGLNSNEQFASKHATLCASKTLKDSDRLGGVVNPNDAEVPSLTRRTAGRQCMKDALPKELPIHRLKLVASTTMIGDELSKTRNTARSFADRCGNHGDNDALFATIPIPDGPTNIQL
jgi:hypothetical protein